ncbi:MAG: hypothetical protein LDL37_00640 [Asticcacaulis sp.]|uniref:hypothetical protein n=1 Tax=Asticcacaulis sp. TaxID=1872648 RepID=UPI0025C29858|nr:hypothetical protein [Asticcacaulis sp.]MCA1933927.1 hypothetical protein [Asticcacaulis sp.]
MPVETRRPQGLRRAIRQRIDGVFRDDGRQRVWIAGLLSCLPLLALWGSAYGYIISALIANGFFLGVLITLSWKSPHPWPVIAGGCQWLSVMLPVLALSDGRIRPMTLVMALTVSTLSVLGVILWGALATRRRK